MCHTYLLRSGIRISILINALKEHDIYYICIYHNIIIHTDLIHWYMYKIAHAHKIGFAEPGESFSTFQCHHFSTG